MTLPSVVPCPPTTSPEAVRPMPWPWLDAGDTPSFAAPMMLPRTVALPLMRVMPLPVAQPITFRWAGNSPPMEVANPPSPMPVLEAPGVTEQAVPVAPTPMKFPAMALFDPLTWIALPNVGQFVSASPWTRELLPPTSKRLPPVIPEPSITTWITAFEPSRAAGIVLGDEPAWE